LQAVGGKGLQAELHLNQGALAFQHAVLSSLQGACNGTGGTGSGWQQHEMKRRRLEEQEAEDLKRALALSLNEHEWGQPEGQQVAGTSRAGVAAMVVSTQQQWEDEQEALLMAAGELS